MKNHETVFHVINCHVAVYHAVVPSRKCSMWLFHHVIVISYKRSITSTEVAPFFCTLGYMIKWHVCLGIQIRSSEKLACNFARVYYLDMHQKGGEIYLSLTQFANAKYIKPDGMISWLPSAGNRLRLQAMTKVALLFGGEAISVEKIVWS